MQFSAKKAVPWGQSFTDAAVHVRREKSTGLLATDHTHLLHLAAVHANHVRHHRLFAAATHEKRCRNRLSKGLPRKTAGLYV